MTSHNPANGCCVLRDKPCSQHVRLTVGGQTAGMNGGQRPDLQSLTDGAASNLDFAQAGSPHQAMALLLRLPGERIPAMA